MQLFREERPTASGAAGRSPASGLRDGGLASRVHDGAKLVEAIGCRKACGRKFPQDMLRLLSREIEDALDVIGEACAALLQQGTDLKGFGTERLLETRLFDAFACEGVGKPIGRLADVEGDGSGVGRDDAAGSSAIARRPCRVRRDAAPADGS